MRSAHDVDLPCPCGRARFGDCCGPILAGIAPAQTAERLMRSRYAAFALGDEAHLLRTWHADFRPTEVRFVPDQRWTGLDIIATTDGNLLDDEGTVEFAASFERAGRPGVLHELSRFVRDADRRWVYLGALSFDLEDG